MFIRTMLEEKGLLNELLEIEVDGELHFMTVEVVVEFVEESSQKIKNQVINTLSQIDFMNGSVLDFIEHLAVGIINL